MSRLGERVTARATCRFHPLSPAQTAALQPAWTAALRVTGTDAGTVDLYVQTALVPNAYTAGRRSVAVTSCIVEDYQSSRLPEAQLVAVMVHELGAAGRRRIYRRIHRNTAPAACARPRSNRAGPRRPTASISLTSTCGIGPSCRRQPELLSMPVWPPSPRPAGADIGEFGAVAEGERLVMNLHRAWAELDPRHHVDIEMATRDGIIVSGHPIRCLA